MVSPAPFWIYKYLTFLYRPFMWLVGLRNKNHLNPTRQLAAQSLLHDIKLSNQTPSTPFKILEVGIGTGENLPYLTKLDSPHNPTTIYGIDNCKEMVAHARHTTAQLSKIQQKNIHLFWGELHQLDNQLEINKKFDGVLLFMFLSLTIDHEKFFHQLDSVCHPHTRLVVVDFSNPRNFFTNLLAFFTKWINFLPNIDMEELTSTYGWKVVRKQRVKGMAGLLTLLVFEKVTYRNRLINANLF